MTGSAATGDGDARRRLSRYYVALTIFVIVGLTVSFMVGSGRHAEESFSGRYEIDPRSACVGRTFDLRQSGQFARMSSPDGGVGGSLRVRNGRITGTVECLDSSTARVALKAVSASIEGRLGRQRIDAVRTADEPPPEAQRSQRPADVSGTYDLAPLSPCLGSEIELTGSSSVELTGASGISGKADYARGRLSGRVRCADGTRRLLDGEAADRTLQLELARAAKGSAAAVVERVEATRQRDLSSSVAAFLVALIVIVIAARLLGSVAVRLRQPRVMGEVVAGILLGPTVLGALAPEVSAAIFPSDLIVTLGVVANLGVVLYVYMVGAEIRISQLRSSVGRAVAVSTGSLGVPMVLGVAVAVPTYELVGPDVGFVEFALFMGVAMSITAFPVLARILAERGMLQRSIGATAMAAAAIDDVIAWFLIALATAFATAGSGVDVLLTFVLAFAFCLVMFGAVRPLLARAFATLGGETRLPDGWLAAVLAAVLLAAYTTEAIGIAVIFGAFLMGLIMPRDTELTGDASRRIEDFVVLLLLPVFFAYTGLRTNVELLSDPDLWLLTAVLLVVAIVGKFAGAIIGARVTGNGWRRSAMLGTLMNTRGLTELIALNLALDLGVISEALFAALVLMALITTFMAGPLLNLLDPRRSVAERPGADGSVASHANA